MKLEYELAFICDGRQAGMICSPDGVYLIVFLYNVRKPCMFWANSEGAEM